MTASDLQARFAEATSSLHPDEWLALGLLASESRVTQSALQHVCKRATPEHVNQWLESGFILEAPAAKRVGFARRETAFALAPGLRSRVLRRIASEGQLGLLEAHGCALAEAGSLGSFVRALFGGDLVVLEARIAELPFRIPEGEGKRRARRLLREAVCSPFDADWLGRVWQEHALVLAEQVLADALDELEPVESLYAWALKNHGGQIDLCRVLLGHALFRGEPEQLEALAALLPPAERQCVAAVRAYLDGRFETTSQALRAVGAAIPGLGALAPLVALLLLGQATPECERLARRVLRSAELPVVLAGWASPEALRAAAKSFNLLQRNLRKPQTERARQSVHQLPVVTPAWQLLLLALDVHLHEQGSLTRHGWARRLESTAAVWQSAGYAWIADQARLLARALDATVAEKMPPGSISSELALCDLLQPEPEWRKSVRLLRNFIKTTHRGTTPSSYRVAWFVEMTAPRLARPALEEFRAFSGWTRGRRVHVDELFALIDRLPAEDAAVLRCCDGRLGSRELGRNAFEALIGHPRVYNGARGRLPIEVVAAECRVEVREEHGHVLLSVEPAHAEAGINVVVENEQRLKVVRVPSMMAELIRLLPEAVRVPVAQAQELLPVLGELAEHLPVQSDALGAHRRIEANSKPCLRISPEAGAFCVELGVRPFGPAGRFFPPGHGRAFLKSYAEGELLSTERNMTEEVARAERLVQRCPTLLSEDEDSDSPRLEPTYHWVLGEERLYSMLVELRESNAECELEWQTCRPVRAAGQVTLKQLTGSLRPVKGWYLASGGIHVEGHAPLDFSELVRQPFTKSGRFLRLPSGDFVQVERRVRQVLVALAAHASGNDTAPIKIAPAALGTLEVLTAPGVGFDVDEAIRKRQERVRAVAVAVPQVPSGFQARLRAYQKDGYDWLWRLCELGLGACLADDMGLGKTIMAAALLMQRATGGAALVVAPTSVCSNWLVELGRVAPGLKAAEYAGKARQSLLSDAKPAVDVLVASYALLQQDAETLARVTWNTVILDEAQFIKNPFSARAEAAFRLSAKARVALTGTPVENHLGDLWSIFHFLNPSLLGPYKQFFHRYLRPIERDKDEQQREALRRLIRPLILRRTKLEVLSELPPITTLRHEVELSHEEALRYALLRRQIHEKLRTVHGKRQHKFQVLAEITRLRRFCCHPRLVFPDAGLTAAKLESLIDLVEELRDGGHRALVFSQFVDFLNLVRERLDEQAIPYQYLDGSCTRAQRQASVAAFESGSAPLFLISLKAGGFGLNLAAADYVIQLDPWWNPAVEAQASDRAHRIGQTRPVTVYRLVTKHTIEERIEELQSSKRELARSLLDGSNAAAKLSGTELEQLLS